MLVLLIWWLCFATVARLVVVCTAAFGRCCFSDCRCWQVRGRRWQMDVAARAEARNKAKGRGLLHVHFFRPLLFPSSIFFAFSSGFVCVRDRKRERERLWHSLSLVFFLEREGKTPSTAIVRVGKFSNTFHLARVVNIWIGSFVFCLSIWFKNE